MTDTTPARRTPIRMCARCGCMTEHPVLVHEVHAATGPGFNVYACPDCAPHYPPPTDLLEVLDPDPVPAAQSRMTIRVYRISSDGSTDRDRAELRTRTGRHTDPVPRTAAFPPCTCTRCSTPSRPR
ncbi:hypothetical protein [Streptomyces poonensis]|uniref:Uncharacterized protein n=1 Tax=Streptomyces poonensis TaxID=68255 RepID=A0A918UCW4_9ACTN|nr:hypothetical protein [Streptomyces poonensis]GGY90710.1 hypothetical protein GCM10010365_06390 [Streptomyces poonensis]GLJ87924.1 hypothetical protein GCM10017589_05240 [Streptomyces poonensis]